MKYDPMDKFMGKCEQAYSTGNKRALWSAIHALSVRSGSYPMPHWLSEAIIKANFDIQWYRAKSWDDLFSPMHKKGVHVAQNAHRREISFVVIDSVNRRKKQLPIGKSLFEAVGVDLGASGALIEKLYYERLKTIQTTDAAPKKNEIK